MAEEKKLKKNPAKLAAPSSSTRRVQTRTSRPSKRTLYGTHSIAPVIPKTLVDALTALRHNAVIRTETKGVIVESNITYPAELVAGLKGMFPSTKLYDFELHASGIIASNASGALTGNVAWSPTVTSYTEWSALAALFDETKMIMNRVDITCAFIPTSSNGVVMFCFAPDNDGILSAPTFTTTQRLSESEVFHSHVPGRNSPGLWTKVHSAPKDRLYATTAVPVGASGTPAGLIGHWAYASNVAASVSVGYLYWAMKMVARFRNRA